MARRWLFLIVSMLVILSMGLTSCAPATPQIIEKEVVKTVVTEKEVPVEKKVVETVVVEKQVVVEKVITATPKLAAQQIVRRLERSKKTHIAPNKEGGSGRDWVRVVWISPLMLMPDNTVQPRLALKVDVSSDGTEYTLHLDPKAVFSNGKPITAKAVKECWEWGAKAENEPSWGGSFLVLKFVEGMDAVNKGESDDASGLIPVDDHTLKIKLTKRVIGFMELLAYYMLGVFDASDPVDDINYWRKPAVSGPYQIEWDPDSGAVDLTPNPKWWGKPPIIQKVEFRIVGDAQARLIAYENNEVDILKDTGDLLTQLMTTHKDEMIRIPGLGFFYLGVNSQLEPTDDVHIRRALLFAIDRHGVMKSLFPYHPVVDAMMSEGMPCYNPDFKIPYDPKLAKEELAKSRYGSADKVPPIKLQYWADIGFWGRILTAFQKQWEDNLGLKVELYGVDKYEVEKFNISRASGGPDVNDPSSLFEKWGLIDGDYAKYTLSIPSKEVEELTLKANALSETDPERCKLYQELERRIVLDEALIWPTVNVPYHWVVKPWIKNFQTNRFQEMNWDEMYVEAH